MQTEIAPTEEKVEIVPVLEDEEEPTRHTALKVLAIMVAIVAFAFAAYRMFGGERTP